MQLQTESRTAEEHSLDKEARKWASRVAREYKTVVHIQKVRRLQGPLSQLPTLFYKAEIPSDYIEGLQKCCLARVNIHVGAGVGASPRRDGCEDSFVGPLQEPQSVLYLHSLSLAFFLISQK